MKPTPATHDPMLLVATMDEEAVGPSPTALPAMSFDRVYAEQFDYVWKSLARLGVPESSLDDAAQDVFVVVHRKLAAFEGRSAIKTWVFGIALRVAHDFRRRARRKGGLLPLTTEVAAIAPSPHDAAVRAEATTTLYRLLEALSDDERALFVLVELDEMSVVEAAQALAVNVNTASARLNAARRAFNKAVQRHQARERSNHG